MKIFGNPEKGATRQEQWIGQMKYLLDIRRIAGVGSSEALSFILREGFGYEFYATPSGLVRIRPIDMTKRKE
jgi:hypothetical protein